MGPEREIKAVQDMYLHDNMCRLLLIPLTICQACVELSKSPLTLDILGPRSSFRIGMPQCHSHLGHVASQRSEVAADAERW